MDDPLRDLYDTIQRATPSEGRPYLTVTFAQSLDGSIAVKRGVRTALSGPESLQMTHQLRSLHDGILVGIGTVLADDPRLTVRHASGEDPQPLILDTHLRTPPDSQVALGGRPPWILCGPDCAADNRQRLESAGMQVLPVPVDGHGLLEGVSFLRALRERGLRRVMVEGGSKVISYFLQNGLVDLLVLTITPILLAGPRAVKGTDLAVPVGQVRGPRWQQAGEDMILWGELGAGTA